MKKQNQCIQLLLVRVNSNTVLSPKLIDKPLVSLGVICTLYFSYIPALYLINYFNLSKLNFYFILMATTFYLLTIRLCLNRLKVSKESCIILISYSLFALYATFSFSIATNYFNDIYNIRTVTIINILFVVLSLYSRHQKETILRLLFGLSAVVALISMILLLSGYLRPDLKGFQNIFIGLEMERSPYKHIGNYLCIFIISSLYFIKKDDTRKIIKYTNIILVLFSFRILFIVGARGPFVALIVTLLFLLAMQIKDGIKESRLSYKKHTITISKCIFLFAVIFLIYNSKILYTLNDFLLFRRLSVLGQGGDPSHRLFLYSKALELFMMDQYTFIFGSGINSFPEFIGADSTRMYPHNIFLELLCEYGIVGFSLFMAPILYVLYSRKNKIKTVYGNSIEERVIFLFVIYFWTIRLFSGGLRSSWILIYFTFLLLPIDPQKGQKRVQVHET